MQEEPRASSSGPAPSALAGALEHEQVQNQGPGEQGQQQGGISEVSDAALEESEHKRERAVQAEDASEGAFRSQARSGADSDAGAHPSASHGARGENAHEPPSTPAIGLGQSVGHETAAATGTAKQATPKTKAKPEFKLDNFPVADNAQRDKRGYSFGESRNATRDILLTPAGDEMPFNMASRTR